MTDDDVLKRIAETLMIDRAALSAESRDADFPDDWDSMGTMALVTMLDADFDVKLEPGETDKLQSVAGVVGLLRDAGKIS